MVAFHSRYQHDAMLRGEAGPSKLRCRLSSCNRRERRKQGWGAIDVLKQG